MECKITRVLHVIGIMNRGGAETMIMNLYRNIDRTKVQFDFVQNEGGPAAYDEEILSLGGCIYHCPRYRGKNHFAYTRWWNAFFREHSREYSVVHGHIGSTAAIYLAIAKKYGVHTIAHSHSAGEGSLAYRLFSYPTRYIADQFFACSRDAGISRYGKIVGSNNDRCCVLHNAVDTQKFVYTPERRNNARQVLRFSENTLVLGHVGRFIDIKNHVFLLEVFARIHKTNANTVLLLVGDGELRPKIEAAIAEKHLEDAVIMTGVQNNTWDYYQAMDVFLMPSLFEGLPVSLVEAQTAGLPCCVSTGVPQEAAITDLVQFRSLEDSPESWAEWVLERASLPRRSMAEEVRHAGYDIAETSRWLAEFYTKVVMSHGGSH